MRVSDPPPPRRGEHGVLDQKLASCRFLPDPKFPSLGILGFRYQAQDPCQTRRGFNPSLPPRGNPPRTVWSAEREEHEQVISTIPKIRQTTGDTRGRKNVDVHVQICSKTVEHHMKNTFKMTSGKGVGKYCEKRCPGQTQHMFGPY